MGTLKREEIKLQEQYASEKEGRSRIGATIWNYNFRRPNAGNGGFAPNSVKIEEGLTGTQYSHADSEPILLIQPFTVTRARTGQG